MTSESDCRGTAETAPDVRDGSERDDRDDLELPPQGYVLGAPLGQGGMGEVLLAHDRRIDRPVAFKRMRLAEPTRHEVKRFLREAKIQARLDHPAIVPVYDIGRDPDGHPYFTMRRLSGRTLDTCIRAGEPLHRLLRAFVEVCLAVQFAHERDTVHRDLKPANVMLGEYGEVYILDWGVARVLGDELAPSQTRIESLDGHTEAGALLGTAGYMAPEQARGEQVGAAADVYSLGAILFEVLAGTRLHARDAGLADLIASMLAHPTQSPAARDPDRGIAPELDAACVAALAGDAAARPTARELADRVQRYLDGDRDLERRRTLAAAQLALARAALEGGAPERRGEAMRAAGHALALEPGSTAAAALVSQLMLEPPPVLPPALAVHLDELDRDVGARTSHHAAIALLAFIAFIPVLLLDGVKSWPVFFMAYGSIAAQIVYAEWAYRKRRPGVVSVLVSNIVLMVLLSRLWGPLIFLPGYINTVAITVGLQPRAIARPWLMVGFALLALALPLALEAAGVLGATWTVANDEIAIRSPGVQLGNAWSLVLLVGGNLVLVCVNALFGNSIAATRYDAQRKLAIQAWHLRQLLPA